MSNPWLEGCVPRGDEYDRRWDDLAAGGPDVHGEAAFVMSLGVGSVLDAGCGTGRVAIELARRGVDVVGLDLDEAMLAAARLKAPSLRWVGADLAELELGRTFDAVLMAGNVVIFLTPGTEGAVLDRASRHLVDGGLLVAGFALGPGRLEVAVYDRLAAAVGLVATERWSSWQRDPFIPGGDYVVTVHRRPGAPDPTAH